MSYAYILSRIFVLPYFGLLASSILSLVAGVVLLLTTKKEGSSSMDWRFGLVAGMLLLVSSLISLVASAYGVVIPLAPPSFTFALLSAAAVFLVATIVLVIFAKGFRPLNLPRAEGVAFSLAFLTSSLISGATYGYIMTYFRLASDVAVYDIAYFSGSVIALVSMIVLLYPYYSWKK